MATEAWKADVPSGQELAGKTVLVGVTGCIAAYKSCEVARGLQKRGARVKVFMTQHATQFVGPVTFRALTNEEVAIELFDHPTAPIHHISLAQEPDLVLVAPATANVIAKMAHGIADDLMSTTLLATKKPLMVAPGMNTGMWTAAATQENVETLKRRGVEFIGPDSGYLACGDVGAGRMSEPAAIVEAVVKKLAAKQDLAHKKIVITAGPTHEPIDPVRYIANRSSGKMGIALAAAAQARGAEVTLVLGPTSLAAPAGVAVVNVETADQMLKAAKAAFKDADVAICAAAVADYTPKVKADHKLKKTEAHLDNIELEETADILATLSAEKGSRKVVGFAAETNNLLQYAQAKLARKGCDAIVANDVSRADSGFGTETDKAYYITAQGTEELPLMSKRELADEILNRIK